MNDTVNVTFVWGPIAGYYAKRIKGARVVVIPMPSEPGGSGSISPSPWLCATARRPGRTRSRCSSTSTVRTSARSRSITACL